MRLDIQRLLTFFVCFICLTNFLFYSVVFAKDADIDSEIIRLSNSITELNDSIVGQTNNSTSFLENLKNQTITLIGLDKTIANLQGSFDVYKWVIPIAIGIIMYLFGSIDKKGRTLETSFSDLSVSLTKLTLTFESFISQSHGFSRENQTGISFDGFPSSDQTRQTAERILDEE